MGRRLSTGGAVAGGVVAVVLVALLNLAVLVGGIAAVVWVLRALEVIG